MAGAKVMPVPAFAFQQEGYGNVVQDVPGAIAFHSAGGLDNNVLICCSLGCEAVMVSTLDWPQNASFASCWCSPQSMEGNRLIEVQSYLRRRAEGRSIPPALLQAWESFYCQYQPLVRREVAAVEPRVNCGRQRNDLCQEVWREIVLRLPDLAYSPGRGSVASWLATVARRKMWQLARRAKKALRFTQSLDGLEEVIHSKAPGPADILELKDTRRRLYAALAELAGQTSQANYEIFQRRILHGQSVGEVADAMRLTPNEIRCRQHRVQRKWRQLAKDIVYPTCDGKTGNAAARARVKMRKPSPSKNQNGT